MVNYIETRRFFSNIKEEMLVTKDYKKRNELLQQAIQYAIKNKNDLDLNACANFFVSVYIKPEDLELILSEIDFQSYNKFKIEKKLEYLNKSKDKMDNAKQKALKTVNNFSKISSQAEANNFLSEMEDAIKLTDNLTIKSQIIDFVIDFANKNKDYIDNVNFTLFIANNSTRREQIDASFDMLGLSDEQKSFVRHIIFSKKTEQSKKIVSKTTVSDDKKDIKLQDEVKEDNIQEIKKSKIEKLFTIDEIVMEYHQSDGKNYFKYLQSLDEIRRNGSVLEKDKASKAIGILQNISKAKMSNKPYDLNELQEKFYGVKNSSKLNNKEKNVDEKSKTQKEELKQIVEEKTEISSDIEEKFETKADDKKVKQKSFKDKTRTEITDEEKNQIYLEFQSDNASLQTILYTYNIFQGAVYSQVLFKLNTISENAKSLNDKKIINNAKQALSVIEKSIKNKQVLTFGEIDFVLNPTKEIKKEKQQINIDKEKTEKLVLETDKKLNELNSSSENLDNFKEEHLQIIKTLLYKIDDTYDAEKLADFMLTYGNAELNCEFLKQFGTDIEQEKFRLLEEPSFEGKYRRDKDLHLEYLKIKGSDKPKHQKVCIAGLSFNKLLDFALQHQEADLMQIYDIMLYKSKFTKKDNIDESNQQAFNKLDRLITARNRNLTLNETVDKPLVNEKI